MNVREAPLLDDLTAKQPKNSNLLNPYFSSSRRDPLEHTPLCTGRGKSYDDLVTFGYDVVHSLIPVWKRSPMPSDLVLDATQSPPLRSDYEVTDKVRGI